MAKIVIFGASGGIGSATARILSRAGYQLHLVGRDKAKLEGNAKEFGGDFTVGDVEDPGLFQRVAEEAGDQISGMVYAVGTLNLKGISRLTPEEMLRDFRVNALGAALAVQSLLPALKNAPSQASVVLFSSVAVEQGFKMHTSISMAKGAVHGLTMALAAELSPDVRVNAIAPSLTQTPMTNGMLANEKMAEAIAKMHALPRLGQPEDMAELAAFLISEKSGWITGQVFGVDGGRSTLRIKS
jgi:NAD(P)-dependent dehydrogenase (short-subunit alcohol dehydrogenase family)